MIRAWKKRYNRLPDAFIVEGPLAGGHLGFSPDELRAHNGKTLEIIVAEVLKAVNVYEREMHVQIPIIAAGGVFDGKDVARFIKLGAKGVQIATRFVTTPECDVSDKFKKHYIAATDEDILTIISPVGMPGRVIKTKFIERMLQGERTPIRCTYRCLKTCSPATTPYCIAKALYNAVIGNLGEAVVFAGSNVSRVNKIVSVQELMDEIVAEANMELEN
jgi:NAD(P)H-dependent flavin oxidoreductase YrpB (nitropropane dioxygenase family)